MITAHLIRSFIYKIATRIKSLTQSETNFLRLEYDDWKTEKYNYINFKVIWNLNTLEFLKFYVTSLRL